MSVPTKQHTLSRFFVAGFGDSTEKPSKNPNVWYYPLDEPPPRDWSRERAQDISVRNNYYTLSNAAPEKRLALENLFAEIENHAAEPLKRLARGDDPVNLGALSMFIAVVIARPPAVIEGFGGFASRWLGLPSTSYPDRARNRPEPATFLPEILRASIEDLEPRLRRMTWNVFLATDGEPFIASDCPVAISLPFEGSRVEDLDDPGFELSMPLNKKAAVVIGTPNSGTAIIFHSCISGAVRDMNMRTAARASSFLIAPTKTFPGSVELAP